MTEQESEPRKPDYASNKNGIAVWVNNGEFGEYLTVRFLGMNFNVSRVQEREE